jgi:regulator of RNase E activity RraA
MENEELSRRFAELSTANVADACVRAGIPVRSGPSELRAGTAQTRFAGRVIPARHVGSVDVFLEAISLARPGDVLVADNGGRRDESCIGDLMTLESHWAGIAAIVIWGLHRDTADLAGIGLPVLSLGSIPTGPIAVRDRAPDALTHATLGAWTVTNEDLALADEDGLLFVPADRIEEVLEHAEKIRRTESAQAQQIRSGTTLRAQVDFEGYLERRAAQPDLTFREHLRTVGGEIEV